MAMAISIIATAIRNSRPKGSMRSTLGGVAAAVETPGAIRQNESTCRDGGGLWCGVVVAAAVALLLADAIGDAPADVAGVGGPADT